MVVVLLALAVRPGGIAAGWASWVIAECSRSTCLINTDHRQQHETIMSIHSGIIQPRPEPLDPLNPRSRQRIRHCGTRTLYQVAHRAQWRPAAVEFVRPNDFRAGDQSPHTAGLAMIGQVPPQLLPIVTKPCRKCGAAVHRVYGAAGRGENDELVDHPTSGAS